MYPRTFVAVGLPLNLLPCLGSPRYPDDVLGTPYIQQVLQIEVWFSDLP